MLVMPGFMPGIHVLR